ncbi:DUF3231 family protein [Pseudalkalibacillus decolorationis]|uniref:DUF3231 family protein n=1 Tax=Pseudalkalibacillus decolorationis TaxID=163879 RepID=UPI002148425D|nr:DUF3231 family protein [Pseudalkalibacillus decolorationis]
MKTENIQLTTSEVAALWSTYIQNSVTRCFYKHFLQHLKDPEIKPLIKEALSLNESFMKQVEKILQKENFPVPKGFTDEDVNLSAPALFTDIFALSFLYRSGQVVTIFYATAIGKVARQDISAFFEDCLFKRTKLYKTSLDLMLSKGVYDRPPKINYPKSIEFIEHQPSLLKTWLGEGRPLDVLELGEIFFVVERNCIGLNLLMGLIQVTNDKEVKEYLIKGKKLSKRQIKTFNEILEENDSMPSFPVEMEVTDSTDSPFSERLIMFFISTSNQIGFTTLSYGMSVSMRKDLAVHYSTTIAEVLKYSAEGLEIMIHRGWMEQPPLSPNRKK